MGFCKTLADRTTATQINKATRSSYVVTLLQAQLGCRTDCSLARQVSFAPIENFLQGAATAQALIALVEAALAPTG